MARFSQTWRQGDDTRIPPAEGRGARFEALQRAKHLAALPDDLGQPKPRLRVEAMLVSDGRAPTGSSKRRGKTPASDSRAGFGHACPRLSSKLQRAKARCIHDHRHGAERHRQRRHDRTEKDAEGWVEDTGPERDADPIVSECEEEVLSDVAHSRPARNRWKARIDLRVDPLRAQAHKLTY